MTDINRSIAAMGRYLAAATSTGVFHNGALATDTAPRAPGDPVYFPSDASITVGLFDVGDDAYALLVNRDYTATTTTDVYVATASVDALDVGTGSFVPMSVTTDSVGTRISISLAAGDGLLLHLPGPVPDGPIGAEAWMGSVRSDTGWLDVVDSRFGTSRARLAGWGDCPAGTTEIGREFTSDGFWLCAPDALSSRTYYVGNVVSDAGMLYRVAGGSVTALYPGGWDSCPAGTLLGRRFTSDGYWVCLE